MLTVSFTASRDLGTDGQSVVLNVLGAAILYADRYITGGASGGDAFIGRWLYENRPEAMHLVVIPADKSQIDPWWLTVSSPGPELVFMPDGSTYQDRNGRLVTAASMVSGFPAYPENDSRSVRSGTWQTIRLSRKARKLHRWDCVKPPYMGKIEVPLSDFGVTGG